MIEDLIITGGNLIGDTLEAEYTRTGENQEGDSQFQRYLDGVAIEGANESTYKPLQAGTYVVAVLPVDNQGNEGEIEYSDGLEFEEVGKIEPIAKEFTVKFYDKNFVFVKVVPMSIITNEISFSETINQGQGQLLLNLNLPLATNYLDNVKYVKVFVNDTAGLEDFLIYTGYLSKFTRQFSNDAENIQATFLSIFSLFNEVYFKDENGDTEFTLTGTRAELLKQIIDYTDTFYTGIFSYTSESIVDDGISIDVEVNDSKCGDLIAKIVDGTNYHLFVGADGVVIFKPRGTDISHYFTYEKDVSALTIPEDYEQIVNAVRIQYGYIGGPHSGITDRAEDLESIERFGRKEQTVMNQNIYGNDSAEQYRDEYLAKYSKGKQNITVVVNSKYQIENIHPGDTIKIRNLDLNISGLQVSSVKYQYQQATLQLEYISSLAQEIFSSNS